ncbi:MAG: hypothetical protein K1X75_00995 [Leptospirales bacterium]|nr:hypothetical protein [Leptospirales bacterium]
MNLKLHGALVGILAAIPGAMLLLVAGPGEGWLHWLLALAPLPLAAPGGVWVANRSMHRSGLRFVGAFADAALVYSVVALLLALPGYAVFREYPAELGALSLGYSVLRLSVLATMLMFLPSAPALLAAAWSIENRTRPPQPPKD